MKFRSPRPLIGLIALPACLAIPVAFGQTTYPEPQQPPRTDPADAATPAKSFAELDLNADSKISRQEAAADPSLSAMFASHDADRDGNLSEAEYSDGHTKDTETKY